MGKNNLAQPSTHVKPNKAVVDALRAQRLSYRAIAVKLNSNYSAVRNVALAPSSNGAAPATTTIHQKETVPSQRTSGAPDLSDIEQRLRVVEAFIATLQQQPTFLSAPLAHSQRTTRQWLKRGTHIATDMAEALHRYAEAHSLELREVQDLALRRFFAQVDGEGGEQ